MIEWKHADYTLVNQVMPPAGLSIRLGTLDQGTTDSTRIGDKIWLSSQTFGWEIGQADPNQTINMLILRCPGNVTTAPLLSDIYQNYSAEHSMKVLFYNTDNFKAYKWKVKFTRTYTINRVDPNLNKVFTGRKKLSLRHSQQYIAGTAVMGSPYFLYIWSNTGTTTADVYVLIRSRIVYNDL